MDIEIDEVQKQRFQFLFTLYTASDGDPMVFCDMWKIGEVLGFSKELTPKIMHYLLEKKLIAHVMLGGAIKITSKGIDEIEQAENNPNRNTEHFPATIINIIQANKIEGSQIQLAGHKATQVTIISEDKCNKLKEIVQLIRKLLNESELEQEQIANLRAEIKTIETQLHKSKPKWTIITESIQAIKTILLGAAGSALAMKILPLIESLLTSK